MKKLSLFFFAMLLIVSISATMNAQAQSWEKFMLDKNITSVVLTSNSLFAFGQTDYFLCPLPLTANPEWSSMMLPEQGIVKNAAVMGSNVFVLMNNNLWKMENTSWTLVYTDIGNMSVSTSNDQLFAWNGEILYSFKNNEWTLTTPGGDIEAVACSDGGHVMVATVDNIYSGSDVNDLTSWDLLNDFTINEMVVNRYNYAAFGSISFDAAWYSAPLETYYAYPHQMTSGELTSGAISQDTIWAAGKLGNKGCIFNIKDLASLQITDAAIIQIRSNGTMLAALDSKGDIYVHNNGKNIAAIESIVFSMATEDNIVIAPNPIIAHKLRIISDVDTGAIVFDQLGSTVAKLKVTAGINTCTLNLPAGIYFLRTTTGETEKFIVY